MTIVANLIDSSEVKSEVVECEEDSKRDFIFVMMSFLLKSEMRNSKTFMGHKHAEHEIGTTILFKSMEEVNEYFERLRNGQDDRPFECRWNYIVVEKVYFGPYSHNEVMGWWKGIKQDNDSIMGYDIVKLDDCPMGDWSKNVFNWTIGS